MGLGCVDYCSCFAHCLRLLDSLFKARRGRKSLDLRFRPICYWRGFDNTGGKDPECTPLGFPLEREVNLSIKSVDRYLKGIGFTSIMPAYFAGRLNYNLAAVGMIRDTHAV
jgi:hypothetical protein